ncbi:hypothetical protein GCM10023063_17220 [Arthrobacter methylotrophus]|uniref:Secreted protein n=1 Tax=Arthrobacter methylotrophus TaxID=121291 RepID=A0ABV5UNQ0_9MICC
MTNSPRQSHPAVQYLKDNIVVIGLIVVVAASLAFFAFTQAKTAEAKPAAAVNPTPIATAALDNPSSPGATGTPGASAGPSAAAYSQAVSTGPQNAIQPVPTATSTTNVASANSKSVTAKDWKVYAEAFTKAWMNTAGGKDAWLGRLKPMVSPDLYAGFTATDISTVPTTAFQNVSLAEESRASKTFRAYSTNGPVLEGRVSIQVDGSWIVDQVGPPAK